MTALRLFCGCFVQMAPFALLCFYPFKDHFRYSSRKTACLTAVLVLALCSIFTAACCCLTTTVPPSQELFLLANAVFMLCLVPPVAWFLFAVTEIWQKKLFVFSFSITSALAMTSVANAIETRLNLSSLQAGTMDGLPYEATALFTLSALTAACLPLLWLLLKYGYLPVADSLSVKESGYLSALSLLLFACLAAGLVPLSYSNLYNPVSLTLYCLLLVTVFAVYLVYFRMCFHAHQKEVKAREVLQLGHQFELSNQKYQSIVANVENARKMRHDLRHHMVALQGMLHAGEVDRAEEYLGSYVRELDEAQMEVLCGNPVVDLVVGYYRQLAREEGVGFTVRADVPRDLPASDSDLSILIGNLLENAVEGARGAHSSRRFVSCALVKQGSMLVVTVDNGFDGVVKKHADRYVSSKGGHAGLGLQSVEAVARKYEGSATFSHDGEVFRSSAMLRIG